MENTELGCHHRYDCINYLEKCEVCSMHYTDEYNNRNNTVDNEEQ